MAVRQLKKQFSDIRPTIDNLHVEVKVTKSISGPSKAVYLISVRQFETLMLNAETSEGARAWEMMLDVKDAVQDYLFRAWKSKQEYKEVRPTYYRTRWQAKPAS